MTKLEQLKTVFEIACFKVEAYKKALALNTVRYKGNAITLCGNPKNMVEIHIYEGLDDIAKDFNAKPEINTKRGTLDHDHYEIKVIIKDVEVTFFELRDKLQGKSLYEQLLDKNKELEEELQRLKLGSQGRRNN